MSITRVSLITLQALCNQLASTPPNPTPPKHRYYTEEPRILQMAPTVFKCQQIIIWTCTVFELLLYASTYIPFSHTPFNSYICLPSQSHGQVHLTPVAAIGVMAVLLGAYIRLDCFRTLGELFTFDLTVHPKHHLVTERFYTYVRHPAYTGSLLLIAGLGLSHLTSGSWATECTPLRSPGSAIFVLLSWWIWASCVGVSRAYAEDKQMKALFKDEWEVYAANVRWWFFPGVI